MRSAARTDCANGPRGARTSPKKGVLTLFALALIFSQRTDAAEPPGERLADVAIFGSGSEVGRLDAVVGELAGSLAASKASPRSLVVADLADIQGCVTEFGAVLADSLATELLISGRFTVMERRHLTRALGELKFQMSDLVNQDTSSKVGEFLGVEAIILGTVSVVGDAARVNVRMIEASTAKGVAGARASMEMSRSIRAMHERVLQCPEGVKRPRTDRSELQGAGGKEGAGASAAALPQAARTNTAQDWQPGLKAEFFNLPPWEGTPPSLAGVASSVVGTANTPAARWGRGSPAAGVSADYFAIRLTGEVFIEHPGTYAFSIWGDDLISATVRTNSVSSTRYLERHTPQWYFDQSGWVPISVVLHEMTGSAEYYVRWRRPGDSDFGDISTSLLRHPEP